MTFTIRELDARRGMSSPSWSNATTASSGAAGASAITPNAGRKGSAIAPSRKTACAPAAPTLRSLSMRTTPLSDGASTAAQKNCRTSSTSASRTRTPRRFRTGGHLLLRRQEAPRPRNRPDRAGGRPRSDRRAGGRARRGHTRGDRRPRGAGAIPAQRDRRTLRPVRLHPRPPSRQACMDRQQDGRPGIDIDRSGI